MQLKNALHDIIPGLRSGRLRMILHNIPNNFSQVAHLRTQRELHMWFYFKFPYIFEVPDFPPYINLSVTERCNRSCVHCLRNRKRQGTHDMEPPIFSRIVDEVAQHPECLLKLGGQSEPAVHPQIWDFVTLLAKRNVKWVIYTNGTLLERFSPKEIIELGFRYLIVSIDGIDAQSYELIRVGSNYSTIKSNIIGFHQTRKELNSHLPRIEIRHVIFPNEFRRRPSAVQTLLVGIRRHRGIQQP